MMTSSPEKPTHEASRFIMILIVALLSASGDLAAQSEQPGSAPGVTESDHFGSPLSLPAWHRALQPAETSTRSIAPLSLDGSDTRRKELLPYFVAGAVIGGAIGYALRPGCSGDDNPVCPAVPYLAITAGAGAGALLGTVIGLVTGDP